VFRDNTFITDLHHITQSIPKGTYFAKSMGEWYTDGWEHTALFVNNKFIRVGKRSDYSFYHYAPPANYACNGFEFYDSQFQGGAGYDKVFYLPKSKMKYATWPRKGPVIREFSVGWTVAIKTQPNAKVTINDRSGKEVFNGTADAQGALEVRLLQRIVRSVGDDWTERAVEAFTPHTVIVEKDGGRSTKDVTVDRKRTVQVGL